MTHDFDNTYCTICNVHFFLPLAVGPLLSAQLGEGEVQPRRGGCAHARNAATEIVPHRFSIRPNRRRLHESQGAKGVGSLYKSTGSLVAMLTCANGNV